MTTPGTEKGTILDITIDSKWDYIQLTRILVERVLELESYSKDIKDKLAVSLSELLENAIRYSYEEGVRIILERLSGAEGPFLNLTICNYTEKARAQEVSGIVSEMTNKDPLKFYITKLKESVAQKNSKQYGLGLARIYHEGKARIDFDYDEESGIIEICALFSLDLSGEI